MTNTEYAFRSHCSHCGITVSSFSPAILTIEHVFCALCEVEALFTDLAIAWMWDGEVSGLHSADEDES